MSADVNKAALAAAGFTSGSGAYRIAEALLDADEWLSVSELADIGRVARTAVPLVAMRLRASGVDVKTRRIGRRGEGQYRVGEERTRPVPLVVVDGQVAA